MKLELTVIRKYLRRVGNGLNKNFKKSTKQYLVILALTPLLLPISSFGAQAATEQQVALDGEAVKVKATYDQQIATKPASQVRIEIAPSADQLEQARKAKEAAQLAASRALSTARDASSEEKMEWVKKAAEAYGIDWKLLAAVWQVESGQRWYSNVRSSAGACGPCQFMAGTWRAYGQDGNGDGTRDIADARDCLFGAAKLLASNGASSGKITEALLRYNHSMIYVAKVLKLAESY